MAIYPNDSKTFSVWLATVSSANFSSKGFIACSRQVIHTINNTAARESSQDPGYEWCQHCFLYQHAWCPAREPWGSGSPPGTPLFQTRRPNFDPFLWEWGRNCMDRRGKTTCTIWANMPTKAAAPLYTSMAHIVFTYPIMLWQDKKPWYLLCVKQDRYIITC